MVLFDLPGLVFVLHKDALFNSKRVAKEWINLLQNLFNRLTQLYEKPKVNLLTLYGKLDDLS
jgi:hypothetical protein